MVNVIYACDLWPKQAFSALFKEILKAKKVKMCNISVLLTNDVEITKLNNKFRNVNNPTNVLSFPQFESNVKNVKKYNYLGDLAMSYETICKEAELYQIPFNHRVAHLFVHGVLHLLGMDHIKKAEQAEMENTEIHILEKFNIVNPYI